MKHSSFIFVLLPLVFLCNCGSETALVEQSKELKQLRHEIRELRQLETRVARLERQQEKEKKAAPRPVSQRKERRAIEAVSIELDGSELNDPFLGAADAQVTVMAFSNFQCLPCRQFALAPFKLIVSELIRDKSIKFIFRDLPLPNNPFSIPAAEFAHCAGEQGSFWESFSLLYEQSELVDQGQFDILAAKLPTAIDRKLFEKCRAADRYSTEIENDKAAALNLGVSGAPSLVLYPSDKPTQGTLIRGAQPFPVIKEQIERLLAETNRPTSE